ncbi:unnamed protein product, partial [marine sediment metagenome]
VLKPMIPFWILDIVILVSVTRGIYVRKNCRKNRTLTDA